MSAQVVGANLLLIHATAHSVSIPIKPKALNLQKQSLGLRTLHSAL